MDALFVILFEIFSPLAEGVLSLFVHKEKEKHPGTATNRVQTTRTVRLFFILWSAITVSGMIAIAVWAFFEPDPLPPLIVEGVLAFFAALGIFGYVDTRFNYCVVAEDHLLLVKLWGKNRVIPFESIAYISYVAELGNLGGFDKNGIPLFGFDYTYMGVDALAKRLRKLGIPPAPKPFPTETMKKTEAYKAYRKRSDGLTWGVTGGVLGIVLLIILIIWLATR